MAFSFISDLWNQWNIRGFIILSLSLQVTLILFAPLRKKTSNQLIIFLLWLAYLMADSIAAFTVGLISHNHINSNARVTEIDGALQAFWASFLLLHLGGPDTIIAFSLEDSLLWRRHLLNLIFQVGAAIYVFGRIFPSDKSLVIPTVLVFLAGCIKIVERTLALHLSSFPKLRESIFSDNEQRMDTESQLLEVLNGGRDGYGCSNEEGAKLPESIVVKHAYSFFQIFKIFIVDLIYTKQQREMSRKYFSKVSTVDALRVISVELNFIYEELYTKALIIRHKLSYIFRIIAITSIVVALGLFNRLKNYRLPELDVKITHVLLFGGIILDVIALFNLVFSDWTVAKIKCTTTGSSKLDLFLNMMVSTMDYLRKPRHATCEVEPNTNVTCLDTPLIFRRWSESISTCNLFSKALMNSPRNICKCNQLWGIVIFKNICSFPSRMVDKIISCFLQVDETIARCCGKRSMMTNAKYAPNNLFTRKVWIFIFNYLKENREDLVDELRQRSSGESFSPMRNLTFDSIFDLGKVNMHSFIIACHIITEMWYNKDKQSTSSTTTLDSALVDQREFSKIVSDYMMYLLLNQPNLMSDVVMVSIAQTASANTVHELGAFIDDATKDLNGICEKLYKKARDEMTNRARTFQVPTNPSKSLLTNEILWAGTLEEESKWQQMSKTWFNLLIYAAINIKGETHVQVLNKGGELLTFIWLLMAHFGCFCKPEWGMYREFWGER